MELDDNTNDYDVICDVKKAKISNKKNNNSAKFYKIVCTVYYHE